MLQELFHVNASAGSLPFIESESSGNRIILSLRDRKIHLLTREGATFKQEGSVTLPADLVSLSVGYDDLITVALCNGSILLCSCWDKLFSRLKRSSRKRKVDDADETNIFLSLLEQLPELPDQHTQASSTEFVEIAVAPPGYTLLLCRLTIGTLMAFCVGPSDSSTLYLLLWRQQEQGATMEYMATPTVILPHEHEGKGTGEEERKGRFPSVSSELIACGYMDGDDGNVICLSETLYSYLFGLEDLLSRSFIVVYGWMCGCVLSVSLSKPTSDSCSLPKVICSLDETVVSIHSFSTGPQAATSGDHNALMFIGCSGKLVLFVAQEKDVRHYELFVAGPVLSTLLVEGTSLLFSSLDGVRRICLKDECRAVKVTQSHVEMFRMFENAVTVFNSGLLMLLFVPDCSSVIGVTLEGRIVSVKLCFEHPFGSAIPTSATIISESIKSSLMSIQNSSNILAEVKSSVRCLDEALLSLNETMSVFRKLSSGEAETVLNVTPRIAYEQMGVDKYCPYLELLLVYSDVRPLQKGVSFIVEVSFDEQQRSETFMESKTSDEDTGTTFSQVFALGGLHGGGELRLRPKLPYHFYLCSRLRISCWCSYYPVMENDLQKNKSLAMVHFCRKNLSPLDFLNPLKSISRLQTDRSHKIASFNISQSTLSKISNFTVIGLPTEPLSSKLMSCLISDSQSVIERIEGLTTVVSNVHVRGLELRAFFCTDIVFIQLCSSNTGGKTASNTGGNIGGNTGGNSGGDRLTFSISSLSLETAVVLCDSVIQRIKHKCGLVQPDYVQVLLRNVDKKSINVGRTGSAEVTVSHMQEALKDYFQGLTL